MLKEDIYMVQNEDTLKRYPVMVRKGASLEMVWNSQKNYFPKGTTVTISASDGRKETFTHE